MLRDKLITNTGCLRFMAPEIINDTTLGYDTKVDIWAIGINLYYMLTHELPFDTKKYKFDEYKFNFIIKKYN